MSTNKKLFVSSYKTIEADYIVIWNEYFRSRLQNDSQAASRR